ncbi:anticodon-binding domain containing protein [Nitzschia inconspicua]|uniref:Anticodon-binding domain containing protein n=1 Tax=Nitzschia inconspicua TaxID=303405 RepID=A0A9K3LIJ2_9STRA|nr:anticodon-binding domain containing protein [Nitzschia inconspicua]
MKASGGGGESSSSTIGTSQAALCSKYPISSQWELTLKNGEVVKGEIYCTDPVADVVVLRDPLKDVRMIAASSINASKQMSEASPDAQQKQSVNDNMIHSKRALEEREKRAIRIAQDSLKHLNPKATTKGQAVFDRLLKACKDVSWKGESIIVLDSIQVDPPYAQENCKLLQEGSGKGSLERVQKIVSA